jgi:hypothetical protein
MMISNTLNDEITALRVLPFPTKTATNFFLDKVAQAWLALDVGPSKRGDPGGLARHSTYLTGSRQMKHVVTFLVALALCVAISFNGYGDQKVHETKLNTHTVAANLHRGLPPYWHMRAPYWCKEDMLCWTGSRADSRTDKASRAAWDHAMRRLTIEDIRN